MIPIMEAFGKCAVVSGQSFSRILQTTGRFGDLSTLDWSQMDLNDSFSIAGCLRGRREALVMCRSSNRR